MDPTELAWTGLAMGAGSAATVTVLNGCDGTAALDVEARVAGDGFVVVHGRTGPTTAGRTRARPAS